MIRRHLQTLATLATPWRLPLVRYAGRLHGSGAAARLVAAASPPTADFVAGALMAIERREPAGTVDTPFALHGSGFAAAAHDADIVAAELPWLWRGMLPRALDLCMPAWVSQEIRAPEGAPLEVPAGVRKEAMRHVRRESYAVELSTGGDDVGRFYQAFYRPYVTQRFGAGALVVDEDRFREVSRGQTLAMLMAGGEWVAGMLFRLAGATLELGWFGSSTQPVRSGASEVLDTWVIGHAAERGARRAVLGHSRPSLADGVVRYKARFGAEIRATRFPQRTLGVSAVRPSKAVLEAINAARFVTFDGTRAESRPLTVRPVP